MAHTMGTGTGRVKSDPPRKIRTVVVGGVKKGPGKRGNPGHKNK